MILITIALYDLFPPADSPIFIDASSSDLFRDPHCSRVRFVANLCANRRFGLFGRTFVVIKYAIFAFVAF